MICIGGSRDKSILLKLNLFYYIPEHIGGEWYQLIGEIILGMVQLHMFFAGTDAKHGSGEMNEVIGKILGPTKRRQHISAAAAAMLFDKLDMITVVLGGIERLTERILVLQMIAVGYLTHNLVCFGQEMLHSAIRKGTEGKHHFALAC